LPVLWNQRLFLGLTKDLAQCMPEAQGPISTGKVRRMGQPAPLQIEQQFTSR